MTSPQDLTQAVEAAAKTAGLSIVSSHPETGADDRPTVIFALALEGLRGRSLRLELSRGFDAAGPETAAALAAYLGEQSRRLRNPRPDAYVTLAGLPVVFEQFGWPFHRSTSGADTYLVHGTVRLEDGSGSPLHARISAAMTVTFAEIVPAPEQPFAESFIYNAVRKTLDQGQLELLKSGNRQPVPVTTRYYSRWQNRFFFSDSDESLRREYLCSKAYWLSAVLGAGEPVWIADPRDAQYLNTTGAELLRAASEEASAGMLALDGEYAAATPRLAERAAGFQARLEQALALTKPAFNEAMRAGQANM